MIIFFAWKSVGENQQTLNNLTTRLLIEEEHLKSSEDTVVLTAKHVNKFSLKSFSCRKVGHKKNRCKNYSGFMKTKYIV